MRPEMNGTARVSRLGQRVETPWSGNPAVACPTQTLAETHKTELQAQTLVASAEAAGKELSEKRVTEELPLSHRKYLLRSVPR